MNEANSAVYTTKAKGLFNNYIAEFPQKYR